MSGIARSTVEAAVIIMTLAACRDSVAPRGVRQVEADRNAFADSRVAEPCPRLPDRAATAFFCDDFSTGGADRWSPSGGLWDVIDGRYVGEGTDERFGCGEFPTNQTLIRDFEARDVDLTLDMASIERVDKIVVLRSADPDNQIEVNFRAERPGEFPADLIVQERSQCAFTLLTPEFSVLIPPHQVGQTIHVRVQLVHDRLRVWIDGTLVLNRSFPFSERTGALGVDVIGGGVTAFDNVFVHRLGHGKAVARGLTPRMAASPARDR